MELYPSNVNESDFNAAIFSARRLPDGLHYRMVSCRSCGLVRSDPVASPELLERLYAESSFDYGAEVDAIRRTYGKYLKRLERSGVHKGSLLEIGCGNGFFLEEARSQGYAEVVGVEPSSRAVERAAASIRGQIVVDVMRPGLFEAQRFDVICMLQVLDHIAEPGALLDECRRLLRPGGLVFCLNHNVQALSAKVLKERSPIVDVEHTYLYSPITMRRLFNQHGFEEISVESVRNTYPLRYFVRLVPIPAAFKALLLDGLVKVRAAEISMSLPLGNLSYVASRL